MAIIVDQLYLAAEIIERFGLPVECIDSPAVLRQPDKKFPPVRFAQFVVLYFYKIPQLGKECTHFGAFCKKYRFGFRLSVL